MKNTSIVGNGLTGKALYKHLVQHKAEIIDMRKSVVKHTDITEVSPKKLFERKDAANKSVYLYENGAGELKRTIVANTYLWLDTHSDVHMPGIFTKSVQERGTRIPHLHDHIFELTAKVGRPLSLTEKEIPWAELGIDLPGNTTSLVLESLIKQALNDKVYDMYLNDEVDQHSVGMQYVKLDLAINDKDYADEYKVWQSVIELIGNKAQAEKQGYFWAVREAKLIEISGVILGSNELTPTLNNKFEPAASTHKNAEPPKRTLDVNKMVDFYSNKLK